MNNSKTNFYEFQNRDYIDWILNLLNKEPLQMITERTYENIFKNGSETDKRNMLYLDKFAKNLNLYASKNYIHTNNLYSSDLEYQIHFSLVLKVDDSFLLIESASSTYSSYTFVSIFNNYNQNDYIDWNLYSNNKSPEHIQNLLFNLQSKTSDLNLQIQEILNSDLFNDVNISDDSKRDLVIHFLLKNTL